jgi:5'-3' exoribonuclease 1
MGVPFYFYSIYRKYNGNNSKLMLTDNEISNLDIDYLLFDYNSLIHPCAQQILSTFTDNELPDNIDNLIIEHCIKYTRYIIDLIKPKFVYIMIDGVAPRAKINQQRERRYKSYFYKKYLNNSDSNNTANNQWDSNKITPGTNFMKQLNYHLINFKKSMQLVNNVVIEISDSNDIGEGEHKMMKFITSLNLSNEKVCIYGLDADLIMLSMLNIYSENIVLLRDNSFNNKLSEDQKTFTFLDVKVLKECIYLEISNKLGNDVKGKLNKDNCIQDYIFLCFLFGNDFLENLPSLIIKENGLHIVIQTYTKLLNKSLNEEQEYLINIFELQRKNFHKSININMFLEILDILQQSENYFFNNVYSVYINKSNNSNNTVYRDNINIKENSFENLHFFSEDLIKFNKNNYKSRYYLFYGINNLENVCFDYIQGLYWILGYYNNHSHNNWSWFYNHHATPFISDLFYFLKNNSNSTIVKLECSNYLKQSCSLTPLEQLLLVLPRHSLISILKENNEYSTIVDRLQRFFKCDSIDVLKYYPNKLCIDMINKEYLWQGKVLFEHFDTQFLKLIFYK